MTVGPTIDPQHEVRKALRRKPMWRVEDFATYMGLSHWQAREQLKRYNDALGKTLLRISGGGANRVYTFYWAPLAKHDPGAFLEDPIEQQRRLDEVEDALDEMRRHQRMIAQQTGANTRDIARLKRSGRAA